MRRDARVGIRSGRRGGRHTLAEKLAARLVKSPSGCWEVQGAALHSGHVHLSEGSVAKGDFRRIRAHVFAWEQANGRSVPAGQVVMHTCDNPRCCNPDHLKVGTQRDNILDSIQKGRYNTFGVQKLNAEQVRAIRRHIATGQQTLKALAQQFGISYTHIRAIKAGRVWGHLDRPFAAGVGEVA